MKSQGATQSAPTRKIRNIAISLCVLILLEFLLCVVLALALLPAVSMAQGQTSATAAGLLIFGRWRLSLEAGYIGIVIAFGGLGSCVHTLTSLATYIGNGAFRPRWTTWYLVRLPVGVALALLFFALLRGGLVSSGSVTVVNPYAVAAAAGLSGLFSKQATDKLEQVFSTIFQGSEGDALRRDKADDEQRGSSGPPPAGLQ